MSAFVTKVMTSAAAIENGRTALDVLDYTMTELGELAEEIIIADGRSYKAPGKDGVAGEAIDVALCLLDLLRLTCRGEPSILAAETVEESLGEEVRAEVRSELRAIMTCLGIISSDCQRHGILSGLSTGTILKALGHALCIVRVDLGDVSDELLALMAEPKLKKWAGTASVKGGKTNAA